MDILLAQLVPPTSLANTPSAGLSPSSIAAPADPVAVQRFGDSLAAAPVPAGSIPSVGATPDSGAVLRTQDAPRIPGTLGDNILKGLQNVSEDFRKSWSNVNATLDGKVDTISELLKLQMSMAQMSLQFELVGKGVSRATQNIDQLVKLQ